jgi:lipopolysaccharide transport system permease protein/teichoic acid transport system permease protein
MTSPTTEAAASSRPRRQRPGAIGLIRLGLSELLGRRRLTRYLVGADIKRTHSDTVLGQLWWVIDPLLQMAIYYVLVTIIFQRSIPGYALFIFAAILPWKWFSTTLNDATLSVTGRQSLIRQIQFPKIVLPSAAVIAGTWSFLFGLVALGIVYLFFLSYLTPWVLLIPVIAAVQFLFTLALGVLLSSLNAFFRDIQNVLRHVLRLWFYLSPGLYSLSILAEDNATLYNLMRLNPFAVLFDSYRAVIWGTQVDSTTFLPPGPPDWLGLIVLSGVSGLLLLFAILVFKRAEPAFARIL